MAEVTGFTSDRMRIIENETVVDGEVQGDNLILMTREGVPIDAGNVRGPIGPVGPPIADGNKGDISVSGTGANWQINPDAVTNAELADMPAGTLKGAINAGNPVDLTRAQMSGFLPTAVNDQVGPLYAPRRFTTLSVINAEWPDAPVGAIAITIDKFEIYMKTDSPSKWTNMNGEWIYSGQYVSGVAGSANCAIRRTGRTVDWHGGWTGSVGAAPYADTPIPSVSRSGLYWVGPVIYRDVGSSWYNGICYFSTTTQIGFTCNFPNGGQVAPTAPFTWGPGDQAAWAISYECAL